MPPGVEQSKSETLVVTAVQSEIRFFSEARTFQCQISRDVHRAMQSSPDLIVFPEDIGTGLVGLGTEFASDAPSLRHAIVAIGIRNIGSALHLLLRPSLSVPQALLLTLAERMREVYLTTFSELAATCGVHIAAGTILLPHPDDDGDDVYNTFFLFGPDGSTLATTDKVNLIDLEGDDGLDLTPGEPAASQVWHTSIGSFAPIICFDAWDEALVRRLVEDGAQMLLVPAANPEPWDKRVSSERHEGMYSRVAEHGLPGVEAFAVGGLAGLPFEGRSWILAPDPDQPSGVRTLARAESATEPGIISATVELPPPQSTEARGDTPDGTDDASPQ